MYDKIFAQIQITDNDLISSENVNVQISHFKRRGVTFTKWWMPQFGIKLLKYSVM